MNIYNLIGIGIGPYNLSLAVMLEKVPGLTGLFFDKTPEFSWHPGMLIEGSEMQVPCFKPGQLQVRHGSGGCAGQGGEWRALF
ncbi:putative peptide monooxygenase [Mycobacteroides abscessus subsp. abscessus]|nr:putative peptide monooxygenase [Mycobacteroides abscessus subsp. abscessus]